LHQAGVLIYHCMMHGNMKLSLHKEAINIHTLYEIHSIED